MTRAEKEAAQDTDVRGVDLRSYLAGWKRRGELVLEMEAQWLKENEGDHELEFFVFIDTVLKDVRKLDEEEEQ